MERLKAIVTAGGTSEPIDDVRVITNLSTGRFGHALAAELTDNGVDVVELCPRSTTERQGVQEDVTYEHFDTTESLRSRLVERPERPDIILHAAAVSDYKPIRTEGKISSDEESMSIDLERTPKIIGELRARYGSETFIAGFKLLSDVSEEQLIGAAMKQLKLNRLNMVVANDLQNLRDGNHPLIAVTAEGGAIPFNGERSKVARELAKFMLRRVDVHWFRSFNAEEVESPVPNTAFGEVLSLAHDMNLLTDESGNISVNVGEGRLLVSPRQVDKSLLTEEDAMSVKVDTSERVVTFSGDRKPSIDTGVSSLLYQKYPDLEAIVHFHNGWGRMNVRTEFPFPCGVKEEADEMIISLERAGNPEVGVELVHHGYLLGLKAGDRERLREEWQGVRSDFLKHLDEIDQRDSIDENLLRPIFDGLSVAGVIHDHQELTAVFLGEHARGTGIGKEVVNQLIKRRYKVQTVDDCNVRDFYKKHGFSEVYDHDSGIYILTPPERQLEREFEI